MMYPVVKPSSIEITNALNTSQNLCIFDEVGKNTLELLQRWESSKQSSSLSYFNRKQNFNYCKISICFRSFLLVPWEFEIADVHCIRFLKNFRTAFSQKTSWLNLLNLSLKKMQQSKAITTKNQKVVSFISCAIHFIFHHDIS